ncbi:MAG: TonB family protein [Pyrinomonadaceae bacterium]|nr:TonB family protein [Pyrinomonadaceae bacterium]
MFSNLIESSSHRGEFKRRGSFLLFTTASYVLLFVVAGVVSIYAYDARMEEGNLELVTMMPLVDLPVPPVPVPIRPSTPSSPTNAANNRNYFQREIAMADVNEPTKVPEGIETKPNVNLPMPRGVVVPGPDSDPGAGTPGNGTGNGGPGQGNSVVVVPIDTPPPPQVVQNSPPKVLKKSIINGDAIFLPKPPYPEMARQMKIQGAVNVQVLVDETGKVISAKVVSGHPFLTREAQRAALQVRFSPTILGDQPVKVSGVITYNFVLQQ